MEGSVPDNKKTPTAKLSIIQSSYYSCVSINSLKEVTKTT
jgi:hypothetical protein